MITWAAIRLLASGALDGLLRGLSAVSKWLVSDWRNAPLVWFVALYLVNAIIVVPSLNRRIAGLEGDLLQIGQLLEATQLAHVGTISNFIDASAKAQADAKANVIRVRLDQEEITDATVRLYRADRDALRARFDRLRAANAAAGNPRRADPAGLPGARDAAGGTDAPSGQDGIPAPGALSLDDALIASEQALQLDALIDWVEAQAAVRFTPANPDQMGDR